MTRGLKDPRRTGVVTWQGGTQKSMATCCPVMKTPTMMSPMEDTTTPVVGHSPRCGTPSTPSADIRGQAIHGCG